MMKEKKSSTKFFIAGLIIILLAPFLPDFLMDMINSDSIYIQLQVCRHKTSRKSYHQFVCLE